MGTILPYGVHSQEYIRAERLGDWEEHLYAVKNILPYFHAAGHFLYAKTAHLYLRDVLEIQNKMEKHALKKFIDGVFTIRRSNKFNCGTWNDMVIEQSLMTLMKSEGEVAHGRSTQERVMSKWVHGMHALNTISEDIETFCKVTLNIVDQHVDVRDSRIKRDNANVNKFIEWFTIHNPFPESNHIMSLTTGITGNDKINCYDAYNIM